MDFYDGKIFNGVIYYVPKSDETNNIETITNTFTVGRTHRKYFGVKPAPRKRRKQKKEKIHHSNKTKTSGKTYEDSEDKSSGETTEDDDEFPPKLRITFPISGRKFKIEGKTTDVGLGAGNEVKFRPVLVEKMNISYMNYKLNKYIDKKDFKKLMALSKHVENPYKHLAFDYKHVTDQIKSLARNELITNRHTDFYIRMVGLYDEFVKDNIEILFLPDVSKEISFIHSYMQEYHFDHIALNERDKSEMPVKQANYEFVITELCGFCYNQINKERKAQGKNWRVRDKYGAQIKRFLDYHATNLNKRRSIETFHIIDRGTQQSYFPNMMNNYDTSSRFNRKGGSGAGVSVTNTDTTDRFGRPRGRFRNTTKSSKKRTLENPSLGDPKRKKLMLKFDTSFGLESFMDTFLK